VSFLWHELRLAVPMIVHGNPYLLSIIWFTVQVAGIATAAATAIGLPIGVALGLGRFRGRRVLIWLANAGLALPPVLVGLILFLLFVPQGPLGGLRLELTRQGVFVAQAVLALPFVAALSAAAIMGLPAGLLAQARAFGAGPVALAALAVREARIGVIAAVIAALATTLSEVGAILIVGGNVYGYDQTLASAALYEVNAASFADALAIGIVLVALIVVLLGGLSLLQERGGGIRWRFRPLS
jgi:tungstate transport system permease protein